MLRSKPKPEAEWKGGRLILRGSCYHQMRVELCELAGEMCEVCPAPHRVRLQDGEAHHIHGRGGGRRDDRLWIGHERNLLWGCKTGHERQHVPAKVVPAKPKPDELRKMLGLSE